MAPPTSVLSVQVERPTPYTFDLGLLVANDPNPLPSPADAASPSADLEERLAANARDGAQALINQLLTTVPLQSTTAGVLLTLPPATTSLPREKPLPAAKEQTKWERFAARKGIKPQTREQRRAKRSAYNEETGEWERTWGYGAPGKGMRRKEGEVPRDWVVEVDQNGEPVGGDKKAKTAKAKAKAKGKKA